MSDELAQLKDDLAKLLEAAKIYDARYKGADWKATLGIIESRIARLEAEQDDPWRLAQNCIEGWRKSDYNAHVVAFFDHLTAERDRLAARVAELEAENEPPFGPSDDQMEREIMSSAVNLMNELGTDADDPILDPASVLATAVNVLGNIHKKKLANDIFLVVQNLNEDAKPYRLKGGGE